MVSLESIISVYFLSYRSLTRSYKGPFTIMMWVCAIGFLWFLFVGGQRNEIVCLFRFYLFFRRFEKIILIYQLALLHVYLVHLNTSKLIHFGALRNHMILIIIYSAAEAALIYYLIGLSIHWDINFGPLNWFVCLFEWFVGRLFYIVRYV